MKMKIIGPVIAGLILAAASSAHAAMLTVSGGTTTMINGVTTSTFDGVGTGLVPTDSVEFFDSGTLAPFGLSLSAPAEVTFEFLGREATFLNTFDVGVNNFTNGTTTAGATFSNVLGAGTIPFTFTSLGAGLVAPNGGPIDSPLAYAIAILSDTSVIVLFDDGGPGIDLDDMAVKVSVSQVPLPPAIWLLISAILGLVSFSRVRRSEAKAA